MLIPPHLLLWLGFSVFIITLLAIDLHFFHRKDHSISVKEALVLSLIWICIAGIFNIGVWMWWGGEPALEFFTGYVVEKALSVDNIFVFLLIFRFFSVPPEAHHRVLFFGVLGALVMRGIFIAAGTALLEKYHWMFYVLGIIVIASAYKLLKNADIEVDPSKNIVFKTCQKFLPTLETYRGQRFLIKEEGKWFVTPLFFVLIAVEVTDLIFAMDSIPAIFAITRDPFIVFTSNIFAILGLRALYFLLAGALERLRYLNTGLAIILLFIGIKMLLSEIFPIPTVASLLFIAGVLVVTVGRSIRERYT